MTRVPPWTLAAAVVAGLAAGAAAQPARDVIVVGGQHYLRTQQVPHTYGYGLVSFAAVSAEAGRCAYVGLFNYQEELLFLRQFDTWAGPLHDQVLLDPQGPAGAYCRCACFSARTWTLWDSEVGYSLGRIFDGAGQPWTEPFLLAGELYVYDSISITATADKAAVLLREVIFDSFVQCDLHMRFFDPDGLPLTDLFPAANTLESEEGGSMAFLPDGSVVLGYVAGNRQTSVWHAYLRRVHPDGTVDDRILVTPEQATGTYARMLDDGTLLVRYRLLPDGSPHYVRRFDANLQPLGEPVAIDPDLTVLRATSDGRLALAAAIDEHIWMRLYDASWQPASERFEPMAWPLPARRTFGGTSVPLACDDNGTIWLAWTDYSGDSDVAYLTTLTPFEPGDMNNDGLVNNFDITPFVMALTDPAAYQQQFPGVPYEFYGDISGDGSFNNFDITPFVQLLTGR